MVGTDGGGIQQFRAIAEHGHPRAIHAANHRAAGARAKVAGVDARLCGQGLAQRGGAAKAQVLLAQHLHWRGHIPLCHASGGDSDFAQSCLGSRSFLRVNMNSWHGHQHRRNQ